MKTRRFRSVLLAVALTLIASCAKEVPQPAIDAKPAKHEHHPPHGGTPVVLGAEIYHVEFVLDATNGQLTAYVLDGEMENFIRIAAPSFEVVAIAAGVKQTLFLSAVSNYATGEKTGDTSMFQTSADWLKTTKTFDAMITQIEIRGTTFTGVAFNFPKGNDKD